MEANLILRRLDKIIDQCSRQEFVAHFEISDIESLIARIGAQKTDLDAKSTFSLPFQSAQGTHVLNSLLAYHLSIANALSCMENWLGTPGIYFFGRDLHCRSNGPFQCSSLVYSQH